MDEDEQVLVEREADLEHNNNIMVQDYGKSDNIVPAVDDDDDDDDDDANNDNIADEAVTNDKEDGIGGVRTEDGGEGDETISTAMMSMPMDASTTVSQSISAIGHIDETPEDDNGVATTFGAGISGVDKDIMDHKDNNTADDSITHSTGEAIVVAVVAEDNLVEAAAIIDQDELLVQTKEENDDDISTYNIIEDNIQSSIDDTHQQEETGGNDYETGNTISTTESTNAVSDTDDEHGEDAPLPESGSALTQGDENGETPLLDGTHENLEEDKTIDVVVREEALMVASDYVSVDDGKDDNDNITSVQQDGDVLVDVGIVTEDDESDAGDAGVIVGETKQALSVNDDDDDGNNSSNPNKSVNVDNKEANRLFVDGLDELDKLFEPVEVPDELDVGADGTSMQEVLVGQGLKIIWKNVKRVLFSLVGNKNVMDSETLLEEDSMMISDDGDINVSFDSSIQQSDHTNDDTPTKTRPSRGKNEEDGPDRSTAKKFFPILIKSPKTQKIWKFAKRKLEQAKHILGDLLSIFEGTGDDDDDDEFELFGEMGLEDIRQSLKAAKGTGEFHDGSDGNDIDESFLKSRFDAMKTVTANEGSIE